MNTTDNVTPEWATSAWLIVPLGATVCVIVWAVVTLAAYFWFPIVIAQPTYQPLWVLWALAREGIAPGLGAYAGMMVAAKVLRASFPLSVLSVFALVACGFLAAPNIISAFTSPSGEFNWIDSLCGLLSAMTSLIGASYAAANLREEAGLSSFFIDPYTPLKVGGSLFVLCSVVVLQARPKDEQVDVPTGNTYQPMKNQRWEVEVKEGISLDEEFLRLFKADLFTQIKRGLGKEATTAQVEEKYKLDSNLIDHVGRRLAVFTLTSAEGEQILTKVVGIDGSRIVGVDCPKNQYLENSSAGEDCRKLITATFR